MDERYKPREPNEGERADLMECARLYWGLKEDEMPPDGYIAIFDHYMTGCPGWAGKTAVIIWDGAPQYLDSAIFEDGKWKMLDKNL